VCVCVFDSVYEVFGPRLFTTAGHAYQHLFNVSLCGPSDVAVCTDNMTSREADDSGADSVSVRQTANVCLSVCLSVCLVMGW